MKRNVDRALALVLKSEGGYVDDPVDPGGATNFGVTQRTYDAYRHLQNLVPAPVRGITMYEVKAIYRRQYWDKIMGDDLPDGVDYAVFDAAVNSSPVRAAKWLQQAVGSTIDGSIGVNTLAATRTMDETALINEYCDNRLTFLRSLNTWWHFGKGWRIRVESMRVQALDIAKSPGDP